MSFTKQKFLKLSRENKIKKVIFAIKDLLESKKELEYTKSLLVWLNEFEDFSYDLPKDHYEWGILLNTLQNQIKTENQFIEDKCYDDTNIERITFPIKLILHDIRSPFNVGAIFRTSEALGVEEIILSGITPTPENNNKINKTIKNSQVSYIYSENIIETINQLKLTGYKVISLEKTANSIDINIMKIELPLVLIVGNEEFGVKKELLELSDNITHIKMFGQKNSINVGIATGIALNRIVNSNL